MVSVPACTISGMASRTSEERVAGGGNGGGERRWTVQASRESHDSINPIRQFEETRFQDVLSNSRNRTDLEFIKLSIGRSLNYL